MKQEIKETSKDKIIELLSNRVDQLEAERKELIDVISKFPVLHDGRESETDLLEAARDWYWDKLPQALRSSGNRRNRIMGRYKYIISLNLQLGVLVHYSPTWSTIMIQLPFVTVSYCWGSDATRFGFHNNLKR